MLCGCLGEKELTVSSELEGLKRRNADGRKIPPTPLDAEIEVPANCQIAQTDEEQPTQMVLGYPLYGSRGYNFDFVPHDNGENYIATFRARYRGEVMGFDSKPIPKEVYNDFRVLKKKKNGNMYCIVLDTAGYDLTTYFNKFTKEELVMLGIER